MSKKVIEMFESRFHHAPAVVAAAPGRLEILGNHTDYNEGFVLSMAVGQTTDVAMSPVEGTECIIYENGKDYSLSLNEIDIKIPGDWRNYLKGLLVELRKRGFTVKAFHAALTSTVPLSAGMSSSAALEMAFAYALKEINGIDLSLPDWARVGQGVENNFMGLKSGLLDQFSSLYGQANALIHCDFRTVEVLQTVSMPAGWKLVVANTLVKHNLVESDYNLRRQSCEKACAAIQKTNPEVKALRDVSPALLEACRNAMDPVDYSRALHVVGEDDRVMRGVDLLKAGDVESFGKLLFESHESSRFNFENSCPELDALVELAHTIPGCAGARLSGGGFGGISIHLVKEDMAEQYCERLKTAYESMTGKTIDTIICSIGDGARIITG
ncbi:MAG: galactokinase [Lentisphaeria bacterium]|nr:galactokinase [Lentisphaeria bacterium]